MSEGPKTVDAVEIRADHHDQARRRGSVYKNEQ